ncbi:MAG: hypothetical protein NC394_03865 [Bacteroides sp.]|nr:hypothetical protein [Bacteroides sp.]
MLKEAAKTVLFYVLTAAPLFLAACSPEAAAYKSIDGYAEVMEAKKLYTALDSGHFYMRDNESGEITEEFTFKYREDGNLTYLFIGTEGDKAYCEFHNGSEINFKYNGDGEWSFIGQGDESYRYYDRKKRHPYTEEGVISMNAYAVTGSSVEETENGKKITFYYNAAQFAEALSELGDIKSFESSIWLDQEGYCCRLDQKGVFEKDGKEIVSDFSMIIDSMNEVGELKRPEIYDN